MHLLSDCTRRTSIGRRSVGKACRRRNIPMLAVVALAALSGTANAQGSYSRSGSNGTSVLSAPMPRPSAPAATTLSAPAVQQSAPTAAATPGTVRLSGSALKALQALPSPPAPSPPVPAAVIGAPATRLPPIAPLSPPDTTPTTTLTTGGSARIDTASSAPGGGGKTLQDCFAFWDPQTHMSKTEWRAACSRSLHRLENLKVDSIGLVPSKR
jgi:hypothetical protein